MKLSLIIPTYDRSDALARCLEHVAAQTLPKDLFEVVVIDDGSAYDLLPLVSGKLEPASISYIFERQANGGPASARNKGIKKSSGDILVFIGDDILIDTGFLKEHYDFHQENQADNLSMVGLTSWHRGLDIDDFMAWLEEDGIQFGYKMIVPGQKTDYRFFYTSNVSVKKIFLEKNGLFDESFPYAAYEDSELGYRLQHKGMVLIYNDKARAFHDHKVGFKDYSSRMKTSGKSAKIFAGLHPELAEELSLPGLRTAGYKIRNAIKTLLYPIAAAFGIKSLKRAYWRNIMMDNYMKGYDGR